MSLPATTVRLVDRWTRVGRLRLHATANHHSIDGTPLVLVHGLGVSSAYMRPLLRALAGRLTVVAPDLPGHGRSDATREPLDILRFAEWLLAWLDANGIAHASLLGNSMGCQIACELARRWPDRVERLVLVGPTFDPAIQAMGSMLAHFVACAPGERFAILPVLAREYASVGAARWAHEVRAMRAYDLANAIAHVTAPMLIVRGERDRVAGAAWCDALARLAPNAQRATVLAWGHALNFSAADALAPMVIDFLRDETVPLAPVLPETRPVWGRTAAALAVGVAIAILARRRASAERGR